MKPMSRRSSVIMLTSVLVASLTAIAQPTPTLTGSYGFTTVLQQVDTGGSTGAALVGVLNFDGAGKLTGTYTAKERTGDQQDSPSETASLTGSYELKPDGTGTVSLDFDEGFTIKLHVALADGGRTFFFVDAPGTTPGILNPAFNLNLFSTANNPQTAAANIQAGLLIPGATGVIPVAVSAKPSDAGLVYSLVSPATASGSITCDDGSTGTWSISIPVITAVVGGDTFLSGNFLVARRLTRCSQEDSNAITGFATASPNAQGNGSTLSLRVTGSVLVGYGKAIGDAPADPSGSYSFQMTGSPFPAAAIGSMTFDASGAVTGVNNNGGGSGPISGTYASNGDSITGTLTLKNAANPNAVTTFACVSVDNGAGFFLLRTSGGAAGANIATFIARRQ